MIGLPASAPAFAAEQNTSGYEACEYVLEGGSVPPGMCDYEKNEEDAYTTVGKVLDTIYLWVGIIAVIFIVIGGVNYTTSQGDPNKTKKAKTTILYAVIGLIVSLLAFGITSFVLNALEGKTEGGGGGGGGGVVADAEVEAITVTAPNTEIKEGESMQLKVEFTPANVANTALTYTSSNPSVATVGLTGNVTAKSPGTTTITVKSRNGKTATIELTIKAIVRVESITVSKSELELKIGDSETITATINPADAEDKRLTWSSSNKSVATVDKNSGKITAKATGKATIAVTSTNGKKATVAVKVANPKATVLWVGNSKTYVHDIDQKFVAIMRNMGYEVESTRVSAGGSTLLENYNSRGGNIKKKYDYVFLQEQTDTSLDEGTFYSGAVAIARAVKEKNSNVKVYVRKTWYLNDSGSSTISSVNTIASNVSRRIASDAGVWSSTINDGNAIYAAQSKGYTVFGDDRHQNNLGAYLVAACVATKAFGIDATKITTDAGTGLGDGTLRNIRTIAKDECK